MSEIFSNERLVDYFTMFDLEIVKLNETMEKITGKLNDIVGVTDYSPLNVQYKHRKLNMYPKKLYKEKHLYEMNLTSIFQMLPTEYVYLKRPINKYFSLIFTHSDGSHYYGFFLKIFNELGRDHKIYKDFKDSANPISIFSPKYLCFVSSHPFFISFKNILEEIYNQSCLNQTKCYKIENILSVLLYRMYLPKYDTTQLSWTLNDKVFNFSKNIFKAEVSYKLLFSYISIEKVVLLYIAFLMGSIIIFFHSNIEIVAPIIHLFLQLLYPFSAGFSIITNLNPMLKEYLACPSSNILIGLYTNDFDMSEVISVIRGSNANIVYCDIDENKLIIDNNEDMKNIDLLPRQRINTLIDNLCKYAEVYEKDRKRFEDMKKLNIWETFQSEDTDIIIDDTRVKKFKKISRESMLISTKTGTNYQVTNPGIGKKTSSEKKEKFSDENIRALFFDFNLSLFEAYDDVKHFEMNEETQDHIFLHEKFIDDSKYDIKKFLQYIVELPLFDILIQNFTHIVDTRQKSDLKRSDTKHLKTEIKLNPILREAAIIPNFEKIYNTIKNGLDRKKQSKSLVKLLKQSIYNTISIPSPKFEKLPYIQNNIFIDPMHEESIPHIEALPMPKLKVDFTFMNYDLREQIEFNTSFLKDEMMFIYSKEKASESSSKKVNNNKEKEKEKEKNILNILRSITYEMNVKNPLTVEFKNYVLYNSELVKMYYGFLLTKLRNLINRKNELNDGNTNTNTNTNTNLNINTNTNAYSKIDIIRENNISKTMNATAMNAVMKTVTNFKSNAYSILTEKDEYIRNFNSFYDNYILDKTNPMVEFHFSFGVNMIQSVAFCEICNKPNNIWDIRKDFIFSKSKRESRSKCKFCENFYIPYFYVLEESTEEINSDWKKTKKNRSFEAAQNNDPLITEAVDTNIVMNKLNLDDNKKLKKVEYMSFEHIMNCYYEYDIEEKSDKKVGSKKFPFNLFYNISLLMGEIKIRINDKTKSIEVFSFESYMKRQSGKKSDDIIDNDTGNGNGNALPTKNKGNVMKIFRDNYTKKKKEMDEEKRKKLKSSCHFYSVKKKVVKTKDKMVNIKFNLKDLMNDEKFREFEKDLNELPQFSKKNLNTVKSQIRESKSSLENNLNLKNTVSPFKISTQIDGVNSIKITQNANAEKLKTEMNLENGRFSNASKNRRSGSNSRSRSKSPFTKFCIDLIDKNKEDHNHHIKSRSRSRIRKSDRQIVKNNNLHIAHNTENQIKKIKFVDDNIEHSINFNTDEDFIFDQNENDQLSHKYDEERFNYRENYNFKDKINTENSEKNNYEKPNNRGTAAYKESNFIKIFDKLAKNKSPLEGYSIKNEEGDKNSKLVATVKNKITYSRK